jgi:polyhydroxyalkanoate synthase
MTGTAESAERSSLRSSAEIFEVSEGVRLHRIRPSGETFPIPVVLVPSLLSKWYVFDLHPERSLAGFLRDHEFDVWAVEWADPWRERPTPGFDTYIDDYLASAIDEITGTTEVGQVTLLGYSLGGVMSAIYTAAYPGRVRNLMTLTTPIDFHKTGANAVYARYFPIDLFVDFWGNVPAWWFQTGYTWAAILRAPALYSAFKGDMRTPEGREVVKEARHWLWDDVPVAGEMFRTLIRECYKENRLVRDTFALGGRPVHLSDIECSLLVISASSDSLCPTPSAEALNHAVSSEDETSITVPGSHLGAVVGQEAHQLLWTRIVDWAESRSGHHPNREKGDL